MTSYSWDHNIGPLTTTATLSDSCYVGYQPAGNDLYQGQHCAGTGGINGDTNPYASQDDIDCWPEPADNDILLHITLPLGGLGYYSPGVICPSGYATACHDGGGSSVTQPSFSFRFPVASMETAYGCCPVSFTCVYENGNQDCISVPTSTELSRRICTSGKEGTSDTFSVPFTSVITGSSSNVVTTYSSITIYAPMFQIVRQASDDSLLEASTSSRSSTAITKTSPATASSASTAAATPTPTAAISPKHTLSNGAVVSISAGVSVLVMSLLGWAAYCFLVASRKKAHRKRDQQMLGLTEPHYGDSELPGTGLVEIMTHKSRLPPDPVAAKYDVTQSPYTPHELDSHNRHYVQQYPAVELQ